jgi:hypothetical protein
VLARGKYTSEIRGKELEMASSSSTSILTEEEREIDSVLGYPPGYGKLCKFAFASRMQGLISPFSQGPPQSFHPYAIREDEVKVLFRVQDF